MKRHRSIITVHMIPPRMGSADMPASLPQELLSAIERHWGFASLRPLQERAIQAALGRRDSLVVLPTGGGKSLCYQAPAVIRTGLTVVVSPLIALMKDQVDGLARMGVPAARLDSSMTASERADTENAIRSGSVRLVFVSPERLINTNTPQLLREAGAHSVAVDEAHCVSHWGHDFRPEYRQLSRVREFFPQAAIHAYTATATERVRKDIVNQLGLRNAEILIGDFDRPNLTYRVLPRVNELAQIRELLDRHRGDAGIVYCLRRKDVDGIASSLQAAGYRAMPYHAGMTPDARRRTQEAFASEEADVVVATIAFGMGIDRSNVRFVAHAALPKSIEHYQQETGRAGRDGLPSECVLFFSGGDVFVLRSIIEKSALEGGASPEYLAASLKHLEQMAGYARSGTCRHRALVQHFDQRYDKPSCSACDVCLGDTTEVTDGMVIAKKILSGVARVKEAFGINHVIDMLRGANTEAIRSRGHHSLSTYGILKDVPKADLRDWVYQLIGQGVLVQGGEEYPILKLNAESWAVMKGERTVRLIELTRHEQVPGEKREKGVLPEGADAALFEVLRLVRREEAAASGIPPYQVFPDTVLAELARGRPTTAAAMRRVSGVGDHKLQAFGEIFLNAIIEHCQQTGLATDVPVPNASKPPANAPIKVSVKKEQSFSLFRRGAAVADVVAQTGLSHSTVTEHLADFVRLEKPASIFTWVAEDVCERIASAAETHGTARMKPTYLELNEEVSYDDIRVVFAFLDATKAT